MILRVLFVGLALFAVDGMQHVSGGGTAARGCAVFSARGSSGGSAAARSTADAGSGLASEHELYGAQCVTTESVLGSERERPKSSSTTVLLKPDMLSVGDPQAREIVKRNATIEDMLKELREIQDGGPRGYCILGTRHCSYLHQQIIELLSYALVLSGNHVYTSGAQGTNAAAIRGALRAEQPDLLTVVLPQSLTKQPPESQELIRQVANVQTMPENDDLPLEVASRRCNSKLIQLSDQLVAFAFHASLTVVEASIEADKMDKIVTVMYLD